MTTPWLMPFVVLGSIVVLMLYAVAVMWTT
jgi:hypothetical protein